MSYIQIQQSADRPGLSCLQSHGEHIDAKVESLVSGDLLVVHHGDRSNLLVDSARTSRWELEADTLTVDFCAGHPLPALVVFDGKSKYGEATGTLVLKNTSERSSPIDAVRHDAHGPGRGSVTIGSNVIEYKNLAPVTDTTPATNFTITLSPLTAAAQYVNGPTTTENTVEPNPPSGVFESISFANKTNVTVNLTSDIKVDFNTAATGLATLTINDQASNLTSQIQEIADGITGSFDLGVGNMGNVLTVTGTGIPHGSSLVVTGGNNNTLIYDAGGNCVVVTGTFTDGTVTIAGDGFGTVTYTTQLVLMNAFTAPPGPGFIDGPTIVCVGTTATYTAEGFSNATTFNWTFPTGFTITSQTGNQVQVQVMANATSGPVSVSATNACGNTTSTLSVFVGPPGPGVIDGPPIVCVGNAAVYTADGFAGATTFDWTFPSGIVITSQVDNQVTVQVMAGASSGLVSVLATDACGSTTATFGVFVGPPGPGVINGPAIVCAGNTAVYTADGFAGATTFDWTFPAGITITSQIGNQVTVQVMAGASSGSVSVTASNICGTATATFGVLVGAPGTGFISGPTILCAGTTATYTALGFQGATQFVWQVPTGFTIESQTGNQVAVLAGSGALSGNITVTASNACGASSATLFVIVVNLSAFSIQGPACVQRCSRNLMYTLSPAPPAGSQVTWVVPQGFLIVSKTTSMITIDVGKCAISGQIQAIVDVGNGCTTAVRYQVRVSRAKQGRILCTLIRRICC